MKNLIIIALVLVILYLLYTGGAFGKFFSDGTQLPPSGPGASCIINNQYGVSVSGTINQNGVCIPN